MIIALLLSFIFITLPLIERETSSESRAAVSQEEEKEGQAITTVSTTTPAATTSVPGSTTTISTNTQTTATTLIPTGNITSQEQASQGIEDINETVGGYDSILDDIEGAFG